PAQSDSARHLRLSDDDAPKPGLHSVHAAHASARPHESRKISAFRAAARAARGARRRVALTEHRAVAKRQFGISTHLYHTQRLGRDHLLEIAAHGFETVELFATRTHFDYHNPASVADLQQWLAEAGLTLHGVHAPIGESFSARGWGPPLTLAATDGARRAYALAEAERALHIGRRIPFGVLV